MKIVHATWEQRNMGVDCYEITVDKADNLSEVMSALAKIEADYVVVKVPAGMSNILFQLQRSGYLFIEMLTLCHKDSQLPKLNSIQERLIRETTCERMIQNELDITCQYIRQNLFEDDRISKDPYFTQEQANSRYIGWINDEIEKGANLYKIAYRNNIAGFFGIRQTSKFDQVLFLGGVFPQYQKYGLGTLMLYSGIKKAAEEGAKVCRLAYSSNNRGASAMHLYIGAVLDMQYYVLVKHRDVNINAGK